MKNIVEQIFHASVHMGSGFCSVFGGPNDAGVQPDEGLALASHVDVLASDSPLNGLWLPAQPPYTVGTARRLNPWSFYCACRWDYGITPVEVLRRSWVIIVNSDHSRIAIARPVDWGPGEHTGRAIDLSPGLAGYLGVTTDDVVDYALWTPTWTQPEAAAD